MYWDIFPREEIEAYLKGQHGDKMGFGSRPAVVVVDMTYAFIDPKYILAQGDSGWNAVAHSKTLLAEARNRKVPIIYTRPSPRVLLDPAAGSISRKRISAMREVLAVPKSNDVVSDVAPQEGEMIIERTCASAFFGTDLVKALNYHSTDTVIVVGASTSGCVRATVIDAASYNYHVIVPFECVADRSELSHKVNLVEMDMKYADVVETREVLDYLRTKFHERANTTTDPA
jgi:nicotinamidase-related amidase